MTVIVVELMVLMVGLAVLMAHALYTGMRRRRRDAALRAAGAALQSALDDPGSTPAVLGPLIELSPRQQIETLCAVATSLGGMQRQRLAAFAQELGILGAAGDKCRSRLWWKRLQGARLLSLLGTGESVVPGLLEDPNPVVRTEAVRWVAGHPKDPAVDRLLAMLGADHLAPFAVEDSLIRIGETLTPRLAEHLLVASDDALRAGLRVAVSLAGSALLPPGLKLCESEDPEARALSAELIGATGGEAAVEVLTRMVRDPEPKCRAAAAQALGRLGHWPAASSLAELLGDRAWEVRQHAGAALRSLGSPGMLFLRRSLSSDDPFAADVARQMLDLPDSAIRGI